MSIVSEIKELESLETEIKSLASRLKQLRQKKSQIEDSITEYLENNNHPGVKYQGKAFVTDKKSKIKRKTKSERETDAMGALSRYVDNPEQVYKDVVESMRGYETEKTVLKVKKIK
tara:strand:+ start:154 stop:501 length:348 start_codon:yes stop_codon:yes gene_type:complete